MVRIAIGIEEQLDSSLGAYAAVKRGDTSQATINEIVEAALIQLLEEEPDIRICRPLMGEEWELETPIGRFRIRDGRVETLPGKLPADFVAETLVAMYKEAEDTNETANHYLGR